MTTLQGFQRPHNPIGTDLAAHIALYLATEITDATVSATDVVVTGTITEADRPRIQHALDRYSSTHIYQTLLVWAADAAGAADSWATLTNAQKDAINKTVITRLGLLCERLAELLRLLGAA